MSWDFVEVNAVGEQTGGFAESLRWTLEAIEGTAATQHGHANQADAAKLSIESKPFVSTDPPYYDNIGYADLSDFFYVWLRRSLQQQASEKSGVHTVSIARFETDVRTPTIATLMKLAEAYGVDVCILIPVDERDGKPTKPTPKKGKK